MSCGTILGTFRAQKINKYTEIAFNRYRALIVGARRSLHRFCQHSLVRRKYAFRILSCVFDFFLGHVERSWFTHLVSSKKKEKKKRTTQSSLHLAATLWRFFVSLYTDAGISSSMLRKMIFTIGTLSPCWTELEIWLHSLNYNSILSPLTIDVVFFFFLNSRL